MFKIPTATQGHSSGPLQQNRSLLKSSDYVKVFPGQHTSRQVPDYRTSRTLGSFGDKIPFMKRIWCCTEFESHGSGALHKDGFRAVLVWRGRRGFLSLLEFGQDGKQPPDPCEGGIRINFCPWCGRNLEQYYASAESLTAAEEQ